MNPPKRSRTKFGRPRKSPGEFLADLLETAESPTFKAETRALLQQELLRLGVPLREFIDPLQHGIDLIDERGRTHLYASNVPWPRELLESPL